MDPYIGEIRLFPWGKIPDGWAACNGAEFRIHDNQALYTVIGNTYGGVAGATFKLPDLRERSPLHAGEGPDNIKYLVGLPTGVEKAELTTAQIPRHSHHIQAVNAAADQVVPEGHLLATVAARGAGGKPAPIYGAAGKDEILLAGDSIATTGDSEPHNNMQPYLALNYCIALRGRHISPQG